MAATAAVQASVGRRDQGPGRDGGRRRGRELVTEGRKDGPRAIAAGAEWAWGAKPHDLIVQLRGQGRGEAGRDSKASPPLLSPPLLSPPPLPP